MKQQGRDGQIWRQAQADDYIDLIKSFAVLGDPSYLTFNRRTIPNLGQSYGVRLPVLRRILQAVKKNPHAKAIWEKLYVGESFEERMLAGMLLPELDPAFEPTYERILRFLPQITNWAVCDTTAGALKDWARHHECKLLNALPGFIRSEEPWTRRFGVILLLHFQTPQYLKAAENLIAHLRDEREYYVLMGIAWVMSYYFFVDPEAVAVWLQRFPNDEGVNLTIRKIGESRRGTAEMRSGVKKYKR